LDKIRVTYSGLIAFIVSIASVVTGLIFTVIVTRQLSIEEFGTWGVINGVIIYAMIINPIVSYWATREIARGLNTAKTAFVTSGLLSTGGIVIFVTVAFVVGIQSNADLDVMLFAAILIPLAFLDTTFTAINLGHRPQAVGIGNFSFELTKISGAVFFIHFLNYGVEGAILAVAVSHFVKILVQVYFAKEKLKEKFEMKYIIKWTKFFWLPVYRNLPGLIAFSDIVIFSIITGSVTGVAYYTSAKTVGMLVNHVRTFSTGLYPKLLQSEKEEYLEENFIKLIYFAFPLTALSIVFASPGLFILNPIYQVATPFVIFISLRMFLKSINQVFFQALQGIENIDKNEKSSFRDYFKSKLVWIPTFDLIRHGIYIGILAILLIILVDGENSELDLVYYWAMIGLLIEIPLSVYIFKLTKKSFKLKIDLKSAFKYFIVTIIIFTSTFILMEENLIYRENIFEFIPSVLPFFIFSIIGYVGLTYLIDNRTKILFNAVFSELKTKMNK